MADDDAARVVELTEQLEQVRHEVEHLTFALANSRRIGAAVGIVMATTKLTEQAAFEFLRDASQRLNTKLVDLADAVVETGALPRVPPGPSRKGAARRTRGGSTK